MLTETSAIAAVTQAGGGRHEARDADHIELVFLALPIAMVIGIPLGVISAVRRDKP